MNVKRLFLIFFVTVVMVNVSCSQKKSKSNTKRPDITIKGDEPVSSEFIKATGKFKKVKK